MPDNICPKCHRYLDGPLKGKRPLPDDPKLSRDVGYGTLIDLKAIWTHVRNCLRRHKSQ